MYRQEHFEHCDPWAWTPFGGCYVVTELLWHDCEGHGSTKRCCGSAIVQDFPLCPSIEWRMDWSDTPEELSVTFTKIWQDDLKWEALIGR